MIASFARATAPYKTVTKWRKRASVEDMKSGPSEPRPMVLSEGEEAVIAAFGRHTTLML